MNGRQPVVYLLDRYPELSQTFVHNEIAELVRRGVMVEILALNGGRDAAGPWHDHRVVGLATPVSRAAADNLHWMLRRPGRYSAFLLMCLRTRGIYARSAVRNLPTAARRLVASRPARIHSHFAWQAGYHALYLSRLLGVPGSITVHARDIYLPDRRLARALRHYDIVVNVCQFNVDWLRRQHMPLRATAIVPCGVSVESTPPTPAEATMDVLVIARLVEKKGVDLLVRAVALLRERHGAQLSVGVIGEGPERARVERLVGDLGLQDEVRLLGALDHPSALDMLAATRVFCLPCRTASDGDSDALPVVLREAMVRGVPVVSTRVAGVPEAVPPGTGWLVRPEDPAALADSLWTALSLDEADRQAVGMRARAHVLRTGTLEKQGQDLLRAWTFASGTRTITHLRPRTPEGRVLVAAVVALTVDDRDVAACIRADAGRRLLRLASAHRVMPWLRRALTDTAVSPQVAHEIRASERSDAMRALLVRAASAGVLEAMPAVPFAVLKGASLVRPGPRRQYSDIDLLVEARDVEVAVTTLEHAGYRLCESNLSLLRALCPGELSLRSPEGIVIDLHWHVLNDPSMRQDFRISTSELLARVQQAAADGIDFPVLSPVDALLHVVVHAVKSGAHTLLWVLDVHATLSHPELDLTEAVARAREWGVEAALVWMLLLHDRTFGTHRHAQIIELLDPTGAHRTAVRLVERLRPLADTSPGPGIRRLVSRSLRPTVAATARTASQHALAAIRTKPAARGTVFGADPSGPEGRRAFFEWLRHLD